MDKKPLIGLAIVFVALAVAGMLFVGLSGASECSVSGTLELTSDASTLAPDRCESGTLGENATRSQASFHGVDLFDSAEPERRIRVLEDPIEGAIVTIREPGAAPVRVDRGNCDRFEVVLHPTEMLIMDVWGMDGLVRLECPEIQGEVDFESCYGGR